MATRSQTGKRTTTSATAHAIQATQVDTATMPSSQVETLYPEVVAELNAQDKAKLTAMTPFARELQLWLWNRRGSRWSYNELARQLSLQGYGAVPSGTVGAWFRRGTLPVRGNGYDAVLKLTGWPEAHLLALLGLKKRPPAAPMHPWEFARMHAPARFTDPGVLANVLRWIDDLQRAHEKLLRTGAESDAE